MSKKILMACCNYWYSPFQVGSHQIARAFVEEGWEVAFISDPISPLHLLGGSRSELRQRFEIYKVGGKRELGNRLWTYVPAALFTPHNTLFSRSNFVSRNWAKITWPRLGQLIKKEGFGSVDLIYLDSVRQHFWLNQIKYGKAVFRIADRNSGFGKFSASMNRLEHELVHTVDLVVYTAETLRSYVEKMDPIRAEHLPNGVNFGHFASGDKTLPPEFASIPNPRAIYIGALDVWFDYDLINYAAEKMPHVSFVFIGPDDFARKKLKPRRNIYLLGRRLYRDLPSYLYNSDLGLIPFNVSKYPELVNSINPLKLYEYMACGLPVVAARWDELTKLKTPARLYRSDGEFVEALHKVLARADNPEVLKEFAARQDWTERVHRLLNLLEIEK